MVIRKALIRLRDAWYRRAGDVELLRREVRSGLEALLPNFQQAHDLVERYRGLNGLSGAVPVHWTLFAGWALQARPERFLEIGILDGQFARFMASAFPHLSVTTVDLPEEDPRFCASYNRDDESSRLAFLRFRDEQIDLPNIEFVRCDSFFLPEAAGSEHYDLIWVDGGHLYPVVAWDICNAWHSCRPGGWIAIDDIAPPGFLATEGLVNEASFEVFQYLQNYVAAEGAMVLKKATSGSLDPRRRKYVGVIRR